MMMVITWLLTMAGFVLIFAELGWKWTAIPISENPHPLLGCVTTGLCFIQPIMALFRPHPGASKYVYHLNFSRQKLKLYFIGEHYLIGFIGLSVTLLKLSELWPFSSLWI